MRNPGVGQEGVGFLTEGLGPWLLEGHAREGAEAKYLNAVGVGATMSGSEDVLLGGSPLVRSIEELKTHCGLKCKLSSLGAALSPSRPLPPLPSQQSCPGLQPRHVSHQRWGDRVCVQGPLLTLSPSSGGS